MRESFQYYIVITRRAQCCKFATTIQNMDSNKSFNLFIIMLSFFDINVSFIYMRTVVSFKVRTFLLYDLLNLFSSVECTMYSV